MNVLKASVVTENPGGTGNPAWVSRPRLAPFPPTRRWVPESGSPKRRMDTSVNVGPPLSQSSDRLFTCAAVTLRDNDLVRPAPVPHRPPQDLPRRRLGEGRLVPHLARLRPLEAGDVPGGVVQDLVDGDVLPEHDHGVDPLTPPFVGQPDDRRFPDGRVGHEDVLDLPGVDVVAAGDDHVALAVPQVQEPVLVEGPDVAGVDPAVPDDLGRLGRPVPVAGEDVLAPGDDLALLAGRQRPVVVVDDPDLDQR